ncbi:MAG: ribbon-helix-helix domain-containing protein [Anaerolineae bacterium]
MASESTRTRKVTISMPAALVEFVDAKASRVGSSRSQVISDCLARAREVDLEALAAEGYRFYADEAVAFARDSATAVAEGVSDAR